MADCKPCGRSFKNQGALHQHLQKSSAHQQLPTQEHPQQLPRENTYIARSTDKVYPHSHSFAYPFRPAATQQTVVSDYRSRAMGQQQYGNPPSGMPSKAPHAIENASIKPSIPFWSPALPSSEFEAALNELSAHCHPLPELKENGYILEPYNPLTYSNARKCKRCHGPEKRVSTQPCKYHPARRNKYNLKKPYKCCNMIDSIGCKTSPTHDFQLSLRAVAHQDFLETPPALPSQQRCRAVVFDCEMAGTAGGAGEAILLCVSDYFSGTVILQRYINPRETITQMRTDIHGVSKATLASSVRQGQALAGWGEARAKMWEYIDSDTILVGHALQHDLDALRIIHHRVVDSAILASKAIGLHRMQFGLPALCEELLDFQIRANKGDIHDCLEDVLATREVVLFCTRRKADLQRWAGVKRIEELRLEVEREKVRQAKKNEEIKKNEELKKAGLASVKVIS